MATRPTIAGFWHGPPLSWMEQVCLMSWRDAGHRVVLYRLEPLTGVPEGIEQRDALALAPLPDFPMEPEDTMAAAIYADILRLEILRQTGATWVDLDAYCLKPLTLEPPYLFAPGRAQNMLTGVLRLPPDSPALTAMLDWLRRPSPIRPWRRRDHRKAMRQARAAGEHWTLRDMPWGTSGPRALGYFLRQSGEDRHALSPDLFYPLLGAAIPLLTRPGVALEEIERPGALSVHLFGYTRKRLAERGWIPPEGSYLADLAARHGIQPGIPGARD